MRTKKLFKTTWIVALFTMLSHISGAATYYYCTSGSIQLTGSWWSASNCTGLHPSFTSINTYNFTTAGTYTLNATWTLKAGSTVSIPSGVNLVIGSSGVIKNATITVASGGTLTIGASNFFAGTNNIVLSAASGSYQVYTLANAIVGNATYGNLVLSANTSLPGNLATVANDFSNAGTLSLTTSGSINLNGTVSSMGTIKSDGTGYIVNNGNASFTLSMDLTTPGTTNSLFELQNLGTGTITLGTDLCIAPLGDLTPAAGVIDGSGVTVTLQADQVTVGSTGSIGVTTGSYVGNLTTQVFHNPSGNTTDWVTIGSPGLTNVDFTQWNTSFPITCLNCPDGYSAGGSTFGSITGYDEATNTYPEISNTTDPMTVGKGWWVYMGNNGPGSPTPGELLTVAGTPNFGPFTYNVTAGGAGSGYNLVSNPFPSPISWTSVYNNNSANLASSSYATWSALQGSHSYYDAVSGTSNPSSGNFTVNDVIPISMGFYIQASSSFALAFAETDKTQGTQPILRQSIHTQSNTSLPKVGVQVSGSGMNSEVVVVFNSTSTSGLDNQIDTKRMAGNYGWLAVSSVVAGNDLAIDGESDLTTNHSIPVKMTTSVTATYTIAATNLNRMPGGACIILHDNYTNTDYDLHNGPYTVTLNDTETVARFVLNVTVTSASLTATSYQATCPAGGDAYIVASGTNAGPWNYTWKDANSNIVKTTLNKATADSLTGLSSGVYFVDVNTVGSCDNASQSFTLTLPAGITSAYSVSSNTVLVNNIVDFTDNSVNADAWYWDFGDTTYSTLQNPSHTYTTTGTFDATLYAINTTCGDTAIAQYTSIDVLGTTGVASHNNSEVYVSKDATGTFVKFGYSAETFVSLSVYNALGQVLYSTPSTRVSKDKIYLNLDQAHKQMLFISIVNLDSNTQVTKKIFND